MNKFIVVFLIVFSYRLVSNIANFLILACVCEKHQKWINGEENLFMLYSPFLYKTVKKSGYSLYTANVDNVQDYEYISDVCRNALSIFASRVIENFNPLFWIDTIIHLPQTIFIYLGVPAETTIVKILQVLWWIVAPIALLFRENLLATISSLF